MPNNWKPRSGDPVPEAVSSMAEELSISRVVAGILWRRGLRTLADMDRFLSPGLRHLSDPGAIPGLDQAARVLARGLDQGRTLAVWGDYDVDGITATAVVKEYLASRGIEARHYLPNRLKEGYGLNPAGVEALAAQGVDLLLTVDCGVSDTQAVARARELGMGVVVSDHHLPGPELPLADAVCNPRLSDGPCSNLAGCGVAFMLMAALDRLLPGSSMDLRRLLDLVALGTVADVVELTGQNRILVKNGLLLLKDAERPGIAALKEVCGLERFAPLSAGRIGFGLAPRLNAAGRMGDPDRALDLLLARDLETARPIAARLDRVNAERRREEQAILEQAMAQAESQAGRMGLVLFGPDWHPGIIGIVASRVVERFYRPTIMLCAEDGRLKGSGRSVEEFDLYSGLAELEGLLLGFGGHRQAAGLSLEPENLEALREGFHRVVARALGGEPLNPTLKLDSRLGFKEIDQGLLKELEALQPFGVGNPEPVFLSPPVVVRDYSVFGQDHVRLVLADEQAGAVLTGKAWRMAASLPPEVLGRSMSFAYTPKLDTFRGAPRIELSVKDWERPGQVRVNMSAL